MASAISEAATVTIPAGAQAGDLAVLIDFANNSSGPSSVVPSGWTSIVRGTDATGALDDPAIEASYKVLAGGDPGAVITGMSADEEAKVVLVFRPNAPITTVTPGSTNAEANNSNPASQSVTASGQPTPLVVIGGAASDGGTAAFSTASPAFDAEVVTTASGYLRGGYKIYNSSPANHSIDMNDLGYNGLCSFYLRVA